jgi:hypothetical protein
MKGPGRTGWATVALYLGGAVMGCAEQTATADPDGVGAEVQRPPALTDPAVLLADLVVVERSLVLDDLEALTLHLPPTRSVTVEGRTPGEPMPSGFFELNGAVIGTPTTSSGVLVRVSVERAAAPLVSIEEQGGALVADCQQALDSGAWCWADVWAWVPTDTALTLSGQGTDHVLVSELRGPVSLGLPWVHHLELRHGGDAAVWLGEVDPAGHVQLCIQGRAEVQIDDGTEALGCP